jgi:hypothetical protein
MVTGMRLSEKENGSYQVIFASQESNWDLRFKIQCHLVKWCGFDKLSDHAEAGRQIGDFFLAIKMVANSDSKEKKLIIISGNTS